MSCSLKQYRERVLRDNYVDARYVTVTGAQATVRCPFKPTLQCEVVHCHCSGRCGDTGRCYFLNERSATVYCVDKGLKGGGCFGSKAKIAKTGDFYSPEEQEKASAGLQKALRSAQADSTLSACDALFDCERAEITVNAVSLLLGCFRSSEGPFWQWTGAAGQLSRLSSARVLRIAAVRAVLSAASESSAPLTESQRKCVAALQTLGNTAIKLAKTRREPTPLRAELRAISALTAPDAVSEGSKIALVALSPAFEVERLRAMHSGTALSLIADFYDTVALEQRCSLVDQVVTVTAVEFAVRTPTAADVQFLSDFVARAKRWATCVLCAGVVRRWLASSDLPGDVVTACVNLLRVLCSFRVFVHRSNWKTRSGALWSVFALHETSLGKGLQAAIAPLVAERRTMERDREVLAGVEGMQSFSAVKPYTAAQEQFAAALDREVSDLSAFIDACKSHVHDEQSEAQIADYQKGIQKQLKRACEVYEEMNFEHSQLRSRLRLVRELTNTIESMLTTQNTLKVDLTLGTVGKGVSTLPRMKLVEERFAGRSEELAAVSTLLSDVSAPKAVAIVGAEGMGKSWLAFRYAQVHESDYDAIAYIQADSASSIFSSLVQFGAKLNSTKCTDRDTFEWTRDYVQSASRVLVIYDNADVAESDAAAVAEYRALVLKTKGHVVLTSRSQWAMELVQVGPLSAADAVGLIQQEVKGCSAADAQSLSEELGRVPLAVTQAASLIKRKQCTVAEFLVEFREHLLENPTATVLGMCLAALTDEAKSLMEMMALLHGAHIPHSIVHGLKREMTEAAVRSVLSDLRSADFIDLDADGVIVNRSFQQHCQRFCQQAAKCETAVSTVLSDASQQGSNTDFVSQGKSYLSAKETSHAEDSAIAKKVADKFEDWDLLCEEHMMREKQLQEAAAAHVPPAQSVADYIDSARRFFRCKKVEEGEREFEKALEAAGDDAALRMKAKGTAGKWQFRYGSKTKALENLKQAADLSQGLETAAPSEVAEVAMNFGLALMDIHSDAEAVTWLEKGLALRSPRETKETVQAMLNLAYFYQTSSLKDLEKAEKLNLDALALISDERNAQKGVIFHNISILYDQKFNEKKDIRFLEQKENYLKLNLEFRQKFHSQPSVDLPMAQIYISLADTSISRKDWKAAIDMLERAIKKLSKGHEMYVTADRKLQAARFYLMHPEDARVE